MNNVICILFNSLQTIFSLRNRSSSQLFIYLILQIFQENIFLSHCINLDSIAFKYRFFKLSERMITSLLYPTGCSLLLHEITYFFLNNISSINDISVLNEFFTFILLEKAQIVFCRLLIRHIVLTNVLY